MRSSGFHYACQYCYARATHAYHGLNSGEDFSTKILVKANLPKVLRRELARPTWTGERVTIGTATDPYQPCEGRYRLTRRVPEVLRDRGNPLSIVTKSTLILRDPDLLPRYERAYAGAHTIKDYLAALQRRIESVRARHGFGEDTMRERPSRPQAASH